jgi:hypothetical protein
MNVAHMAAGYVGVGALLAVAALASRRASAVDALLLLGLWPLYGPLLVGGGGGDDDPQAMALVEALRRAAGTPLAAALPDEQQARALARRMREGRVRLAELDRVLARPDLDAALATDRVEALQRAGAHPGAVATARRRVHTIRRLRELRARFASELDQVDEVVTQLTAQLELVRFAGCADDAVADLAADLCARVEGLDEVLGNEPTPDHVLSP